MEMVWMENKIKSFKNKIQVAFYKEKKTLKEKNFPSQCVFYHEKKSLKFFLNPHHKVYNHTALLRAFLNVRSDR
jgi:hypothetical protein